jgi:hypothetical protein
VFGAAGAAALPAIVNTQSKGRERFSRMISFFDPPKATAQAAHKEPASC